MQVLRAISSTYALEKTGNIDIPSTKIQLFCVFRRRREHVAINSSLPLVSDFIYGLEGCQVLGHGKPSAKSRRIF